VTFTASANLSTPLDHRENVTLAEDEVLIAIDRDLGAAVFAVEDLVADLDVERDAVAPLLIELARSDGDDFALLRLFLGGVRDVESAAHRFGFFERLDDDAIGERRDFRRHSVFGGHSVHPSSYGLVRAESPLALVSVQC
jgi:hypothetical protein